MQTPQRVLVATPRRRRPRALGQTGRWTIAAMAAFVVYRSIPRAPDADFAAAVAQRLRFNYTTSRTAEMEGLAARHAGDALLAVSAAVINARVEIDALSVRGPILPAPLPRSLAVRVTYRVRDGERELESHTRCLEYRKGFSSHWQHHRDRRPQLCWPVPF